MSKEMLELAGRLEQQAKLRCLGFDTQELLRQAAAALRASAVAEPVAYTSAAQLGFLQLKRFAGVPMAMWASQTGADDVALYAHPAPAAPVPASVFDRLDAFFTETRPYGYAKDNSAIEQFLVKARTALASLPAPAAAPTREEIINWLRRQANAEQDPKAKAAFIEAHNAILALKAAPAK